MYAAMAMKSSRAVHQTRSAFLSDDIEKILPCSDSAAEAEAIIIQCRVDAAARGEVTRRSGRRSPFCGSRGLLLCPQVKQGAQSADGLAIVSSLAAVKPMQGAGIPFNVGDAPPLA